MSRELARKYGFRLAKTIDEAVNLGGNQVGVAGVLSIGEHGNYPQDPVTKQRKYPRKRFFDEIVAALQRGGKIVPVFSDKHLSYRTDDALAMYRTATELDIPFMAGSSLPVAWRIPALDLPLECPLQGALATGYGGSESYGFHALETLQCMVERREGGESGVTRRPRRSRQCNPGSRTTRVLVTEPAERRPAGPVGRAPQRLAQQTDTSGTSVLLDRLSRWPEGLRGNVRWYRRPILVRRKTEESNGPHRDSVHASGWPAVWPLRVARQGDRAHDPHRDSRVPGRTYRAHYRDHRCRHA